MSHSTQKIALNSHSRRVLSELAQILFYQPLYLIMPSQMAVVAIVTFYFWEIVPHKQLLGWAAYMIFLSVTFIFTTYWYRRTAPAKRNIQGWIHLFPLAGLLLGAGWGSIILWSNVMQAESSVLILCLVAGGFSAAGIGTLGPYLRAFVIFVSLILLPFVAVFFLQQNALYYSMGTIVLVFLSVMFLSGYNMRNAVLKSIELRLENLDLVDDLVEKNSQAEQAREIAELADNSKSRFLAAASHDLRQPLHALGLFVDALESRVKTADLAEIVDNIRVSTDALSDLLNALLDISKLDAGVLEPQIGEFQLQPIFRRIQNDFDGSAKEKSLRLRIVDTKYAVRTDPAMLERILLNLVSNAIRYTNQGSVLMGCRRCNDAISIEIHDTGIGIAPGELENIFDEFYQVENTERDRSKGLGLGLAIVRRQADLLACSLTVSSSSRGSVFRLNVPLATPGHTIDVTSGPYVGDLEGTRVLIIDDESLIRSAMREVLEAWHCQVFDAESAELAMQHLEGNEAVDIILSDFRLREGKSGIEAINLMHVHFGRHIPAIILTGDTDPKRLREAKASGYRLLHKPVSSARLRSLISALLENRIKT